MDINNGFSSAPSFNTPSISQQAEQKIAELKNKETLQADPVQIQKTANVANALDAQSIEGLIGDLNKQIQTLQSYLKFEQDQDSQKMVFFIKNSETGETIRQIPSQELLDISKNITQYLDTFKQSPDITGKTSSPVGLITNQMA
jgi:flagellar protein FlaG